MLPPKTDFRFLFYTSKNIGFKKYPFLMPIYYKNTKILHFWGNIYFAGDGTYLNVGVVGVFSTGFLYSLIEFLIPSKQNLNSARMEVLLRFFFFAI